MIRALIFDLGGVIVPFDFRRGYAAMAELCPYTPAEIPRRIRSTDLVRRYETGLIASEPFVEELCRLLDLKVSFQEFCTLWTTIFLRDPLIPERLFARLAGKYPLILLSNTNDIHFRMIRSSYPLLDHFHHFVLSYQTGAAKPDRRIYEEAIARAGCCPEECFFTDDVEDYVAGACRAGIDAVRFEGHLKLEDDLRRRGIL